MTIKMEKKGEEVVAGAGAVVGNSEAQRDDFPDAFYCPLTEKIMVDPVVDANGKSFERSAVTAKDKKDRVTGVTYYPNRALKTIIDRELERREEKGSLRGRVRALEESLRSGFDRLVEKSALPSAEHRPLPDSFYCPITLELIRKPVIDPDGSTFERDAISNWIRANGTSPVTRNALAVNQLRNNEALCDLIEDEKERTDESIHPSIRRWKMEDQTIEMGVWPVNPPSGVDGSTDVAIFALVGSDWPVDPPGGVDGSTDVAISALVEAEGGTSVSHTLDYDYIRRQRRSYPTTRAEIETRRTHRVKCCCRGFTCLIFVMLASLAFVPAQAASIFMITCIVIAALICCTLTVHSVSGVEE